MGFIPFVLFRISFWPFSQKLYFPYKSLNNLKTTLCIAFIFGIWNKYDVLNKVYKPNVCN